MKHKCPTKSICLSVVLFALSAPFAVARADETSEKLEALQRAMKVPGTEGQTDDTGKKKMRTRAIVFDNAESAPAAAPASAATAPAAPPAMAASSVQGCVGVSPDANGTAVDFAIQFNANSADISAASQPLLDQIAKVLSLNPSSCIVVEGHTDVSGNAEKNSMLSKSRAESVVRYLGGSINPSRLLPVGKGSSQLIKDLDPRNPKHRRVVFKVVG